MDCIRVEEWIEEWRLKMLLQSINQCEIFLSNLGPMVAFAFATRHATCFARGTSIPLNHPFKLKVHYHHIRQFLTSHQLSADQRFRYNAQKLIKNAQL